MIFETTERTESIRSIVKEIRCAPLDGRTLVTVLTESADGGRICYSVAAALLPSAAPHEDACIVHDITGDAGEASRIFRLIADGCVTPCTLEDVLSDML